MKRLAIVLALAGCAKGQKILDCRAEIEALKARVAKVEEAQANAPKPPPTWVVYSDRAEVHLYPGLGTQPKVQRKVEPKPAEEKTQ